LTNPEDNGCMKGINVYSTQEDAFCKMQQTDIEKDYLAIDTGELRF